ncbi:unnamed protein product [Rhizoctonia solani]|uniref:Uncharacterized protein n=1 Tax=Rhizoctonia solani TaxID=456999 RepID=A0A8H3BJ70_9AGAM|nr:unnamed protein product [Rhizoctonia solani]
MKPFTNFFRSGPQHAFKRFQQDTSNSAPKAQNSPIPVDFILVDAEEDDDEASMHIETCTDTTPPKYCSSLYAENPAPSIPLTFHSDTPLLMTCPSSNFLDLRATHPSLPLPMGSPNGPELCLSASFKGYFTALLVPCIWLVLGSYVFVATMAYIFHKSKKDDIGPEPFVNSVGTQTTQETPACDTLIPGTALPTPEEVLEHTLKQYGHLSDYDQDDATSQFLAFLPPPNHKPNPTTLDQKALRITVRKDVDIMFRGTVPSSWASKEHDSRDIRPASWVHTAAMNVIEVNAPVVRIPARASAFSSIPIQRSDVPKPILPHPNGVGAGMRPGALQMPLKHRPTPITTDARHLAPIQHQCFSSSPLKYSYTISSPRSPGLRTPVSGSPTMPARRLKNSMWAPSN